ncbi:glycerophosphodiester phosphodiesterase family protein [Lactobacillus porci]|uniref:glycerophosphodiester phosphodiesterase family protein n=1 Tax=Lactobacillus porci TaxID=2012477 RepID=UPI0039938AAD
MDFLKKRKDSKKLLILPALLALGLAQPVQAAQHPRVHRVAKKKAALSKKRLQLLQGKTAKLTLKNGRGKTTWTSSKKKVAKVTSKGKVKALKVGKAKIIAKNSKRLYFCTVKVTAPKRVLTLAANDGSGRQQKVTFTLGKKAPLPKTGFSREGYKFLNYNAEADGKGRSYRLKRSYIFKKATTLWAQYRPLANYIIQIDANQGFGQSVSLHEQEGQKVTLPETGFSKPGCVLDSFNDKADGTGKKYRLGESYALKNVTLYAQYRKAPISTKPEQDLGLWAVDASGKFAPSQKQLTTVNFIEADQAKYVGLDDYFDYQIMALKFTNDLNPRYLGEQVGWSTHGFVLDPGYKYLIMVRKSSKEEIGDAEIPEIAKLVRLENASAKTQSTSGLAKASVKFIAHRGYSTKYPENTTLAFEKAGEEAGVWGIETDVANTADNQLVILHDNNLARTTNIQADDPNYAKNINELTFDQIAGYKIKGVLPGVDQDRVYDDLHLPTLRQYLDICKKYGKEAFLELKNINNMTALKEVVKEINEANMQEQTTLISFNIGELEEVRNVVPGGEKIALMAIYNRQLQDDDYIFLSHLQAGADRNKDTTSIDEILAARKYGVDYGIWTVSHNDAAVDDLIKNGADKVTLNDANLVSSMSAVVEN